MESIELVSRTGTLDQNIFKAKSYPGLYGSSRYTSHTVGEVQGIAEQEP